MSFLTGALAGAAGTVVSYPFDLLRTTLAAQGIPKVYHGMSDAARAIVHERGVLGLFRGMNITVLEILPYSALQFGLYDYFNRRCDTLRATWFRNRRDSTLALAPKAVDLQHLLCGLASGLLAKLATHPLDVAKKRVQVAGLARAASYGERVSTDAALNGLRACLRDIYVREGLAGLYKGVGPSVLKAGPSAAITFAAYELILKWLMAAQSQRPPKETALEG